MTTAADAIVIGAGAAGLACAGALAAAGRRVVVLEARDRVGGRIHTLHEPDFPLPLELGAEFVHGMPDETVGLIERGGLATYAVADCHLRHTGSTLEPADDFWSRMEPVLERLDPDDPDISFAEFLLQRAGEPELVEARRIAARYVEGFHAADLALISTRAVAGSEGGSASGGSPALRILNGYAAVIGALHAEASGAGADVRLAHEVTRVRWSPGSVAVEAVDAGGASVALTAQAAVITAPLAVLQASGRNEGMLIEPFPDQWAAALGGLRMGHVVRTVLRFRERFWPRDASYVHHPDSTRWQLWWTPAPVDAPLLTGWCGGPAAARLAALSREESVRAAIEDLANLFETPAHRLEQLLVASYAHDWSADRHAQGAYSYAAVGGSGAAEQLGIPVAGTLVAAGEAAAPTGRNGTVDGAIASGRRAAAQLMVGA